MINTKLNLSHVVKDKGESSTTSIMNMEALT